ncbi:toprim domain-containing protein [Runella sp.]|uniref:toprim domain-containing protein n=1 Tax=Runella sp. TaxID=1960881 RepID=UPI003015B853
MTAEYILAKTDAGLAIFRHFIAGEWSVGKAFRNPFYDDTKASCNVYFDKKSLRYKLKDFGDSRYDGDCFAFVAAIYGLDVQTEFIEVLGIIQREMGISATQTVGKSTKPQQTTKPSSLTFTELPQNNLTGLKTQVFSSAEIAYWLPYGISKDVLKVFDVISIQQISTQTKEGKPYTLSSSTIEPLFGYWNHQFVKVYRPLSKQRFLYIGQKADEYVFGLAQLPARGDVLFLTGGEKDVMSLYAHGFHAICFNSETSHIPPDLIRKLSFRFRHIVLLYDMDKAGKEAVALHVQNLKEFNVKVLQLPLTGHKTDKDVADFFRLGHQANDLKRLFHQLLETLYAQTFAMLKSCEIDFSNPPQTPQPLITIRDVTVGSAGNLLGITGNEGSGKSNFLGGIVAGALAAYDQDTDTLGTEVIPNTEHKALLYFDTEQSEDQLYLNLTTILKRSNRNHPPHWFKAYCLTNLSRRERLQAILQSVDNFHHQFGGIHLVVIDGIGDLIGSLNDERESVQLVEELHRMAGIYQTCLLCVLHLVPNGIKLRGHLGSELQRKAAGILCIEKDTDTDVSCIRALKVRSGSPLDVPLIQFVWNKEKGYHTYLGEKTKDATHDRKRKDLRALAEDIFQQKDRCNYTELVEVLQLQLDIKERTAKSYVKFMRENEIIVRNQNDLLFRLA